MVGVGEPPCLDTEVEPQHKLTAKPARTDEAGVGCTSVVYVNCMHSEGGFDAEEIAPEWAYFSYEGSATF